MTDLGDDGSVETHRHAPGTKVDIRTGFDGTWSSGFVVAEVLDGGYRIRRRSDGDVLPVIFPAEEIRRERKNSMWWF